MGSAIKRGESKAIVSATGANTFFGTAAAMISSVNELGNLAKILLHVRKRGGARGVRLSRQDPPALSRGRLCEPP